MFPDLGLLPWFFVLVSVVAVVVLQRQKSGAQLLARDLHHRLEAGREGYELLGQELEQTNLAFRDAKQTLIQAEEQIQNLKARLGKRDAQHQKDLAEKLAAQSALARRLEHLEEENQSQKQQLASLDRELRTAHETHQATSQREQSASEQKLREDLQGSQAQLKAAHQERRELERQLKKHEENVTKLESILRQVDPEDLKRTRRKVKQMEQLFITMRGLKELTEERNRNWEVALRHLAAHILGEPEAAGKRSIGDLVGTALEAIGVVLVDDEEAGDGDSTQAPPSSDPVDLVITEALGEAHA